MTAKIMVSSGMSLRELLLALAIATFVGGLLFWLATFDSPSPLGNLLELLAIYSVVTFTCVATFAVDWEVAIPSFRSWQQARAKKC